MQNHEETGNALSKATDISFFTSGGSIDHTVMQPQDIYTVLTYS